MANPQIEVEIGARITELEKKLKKVDKDLSNTGKSFGKLNEFATGALQGIAAAFSVGAIINFGKAVLDTTAKFQRFEAVLKNTLGSESAAAQSLILIQDFASKTPFAVDELTAAFVKLANQGFKPTITELRSLGDLASSTGKSFDQLAEAVIDAQVGEFERLKEFGIRAQKSGDQVTFTFKGVETQVKSTDEAIRGYILSLGDAEGVSGAMAGISETLGGKLSNLGDNIEQLKLAIGNQTSGIYATSINWLNDFVALATAAVKSVAQIREEASLSKIGNVIAQNRKQVEEFAASFQKIDPNITEQQAFAKAIADVSRGYRNAADSTEAFINQSYTKGELRQIIEGFNDLSIEFLNVKTKTDDLGVSLGVIGKLTQELNELNKNRNFAKDQEEINLIDSKILKLEKQLSLINAISARANTPIDTGIQTSGLPKRDGNLPVINPALAQGINLFQNQLQTIPKTIEELLPNLDLLANSFSQLGGQIANSFNISNNALRGFVSTFLSSTPKIIQAIIQQAAAKKAAATISNAASASEASGDAIVIGTKAAKALGPVGAALLPVFIGAALAVVGGAFRKNTGSGGGISGGVGTSGVGAGSSFTGTGGTGFSAERNINLVGSFRIAGSDLLYVIDQSNQARI